MRIMALFGSQDVDPGWAPYQNWPLGLGRLLWLDLGERRSLGLGAVSLRPLVHGRGWMVLVSGADLWTSLLGARLRRLLRLGRRHRSGIRIWRIGLGTSSAV